MTQLILTPVFCFISHGVIPVFPYSLCYYRHMAKKEEEEDDNNKSESDSESDSGSESES